MTVDEIQQKIDEGDMGVINGLIAGEVKKVEEAPQQPEQPIQQEQPVQEEVQVTEQIEDPKVDPEELKREQERRYQEIQEKQRQLEIERELRAKEAEYQAKLKERERVLEEERQKAQALLEENEKLKRTQSYKDPATEVAEEDEYETESTRRNREKIEELQKSINQTESKVSSEVLEELNQIKKQLADEREAKQKAAEEEARKKQEQALYDEIRSFQLKNPEVQTSKDIADINKEWIQFRKDLTTLMSPKSVAELEGYVEDYFKGGQTKEIADKNGLKGVTDYDKYSMITNLVDLKNGVEYDTRTGQPRAILDGNGNQVRYRDIGEAYRIRYYHDDLNRARMAGIKDVSNKLTEQQSRAVTINPQETTAITGPSTYDDKMNLLNADPRQLAKNPDLLKQQQELYRSLGLTPPKIPQGIK